MVEQPYWNNLPSVILLEVFSYLSPRDMVRASSVCRQWRTAFYHSTRLWQSLHFKIRGTNRDSIERSRFLRENMSKKLRNVTISFDSLDSFTVQEAVKIIQNLQHNPCIRQFILKPSHCRFNFPGRDREKNSVESFEEEMLKPIMSLIQNCSKLEIMNLGYSEDLAIYIDQILAHLESYQSQSIKYLGLASVKDDPEEYILQNIDPELFSSFRNLQVLTIDYDYVSDFLLQALNNIGKMSKLVIHLHGIDEEHPGTTEEAWQTFSQHNPNCDVRLNLIHAFDAVCILQTEILKKNMPLSHLKVFFCEQFNEDLLFYLSTWYQHSLKSLWWVDSFGTPAENVLIKFAKYSTDPDPLVMTSWRCKYLEEIVLIGYNYFGQDLVAISRLRGKSLKRLEIPLHNLSFDQEIISEISKSLGRCWAPLDNTQLADVIKDPILGDSDEFILPVIIQDCEL